MVGGRAREVREEAREEVPLASAPACGTRTAIAIGRESLHVEPWLWDDRSLLREKPNIAAGDM